jgi:hypothetical protein
VELLHALLERNVEAGLFVRELGTTVVLSDVIVRGTVPRIDGSRGYGVSLDTGGRLDATRVLFEGNADAAVFGRDSGSSVSLTDAVIRDTRARTNDSLGGAAVVLKAGITGSLSRVMLDANRTASIFLEDSGTSLTLADAVIRDAQGVDLDGGTFGYGAVVQGGASARFTATLFLGNRGAALVASDPGTQLILLDAVVRDTLALDCAATTCTAAPLGLGVVSLGGASVAMSRFLVTSGAAGGLQLAQGLSDSGTAWPSSGTMDLRYGEVSHNPVGANVQAAGFDRTRLEDGVVYVDNAADFDVAALPVPHRVTAW